MRLSQTMKIKLPAILLTLCLAVGCSSSPLNKRVQQAQTHWRLSNPHFFGDQTPPATRANVKGSAQSLLDRIVYVSPLRGHRIRVGISNGGKTIAYTNGKTIFINSQLANMIYHDESMVAGVLAHELGHIIGHHLHRRKNESGMSDTVIQSLSPALGIVPYGSLAGMAIKEGNTLQQRAHDRFEEKESDVIGAILAYEAGFDIYGLSRFFDLAARQGSGAGGNFNLPIANYSHWSSAAQAATLALMRSTPYYKTHPLYASRKKTIDLVAQTKAGLLTLEELTGKDATIGKIYKTIERLRPKNRPQ